MNSETEAPAAQDSAPAASTAEAGAPHRPKSPIARKIWNVMRSDLRIAIVALIALIFIAIILNQLRVDSVNYSLDVKSSSIMFRSGNDLELGFFHSQDVSIGSVESLQINLEEVDIGGSAQEVNIVPKVSEKISINAIDIPDNWTVILQASRTDSFRIFAEPPMNAPADEKAMVNLIGSAGTSLTFSDALSDIDGRKFDTDFEVEIETSHLDIEITTIDALLIEQSSPRKVIFARQSEILGEDGTSSVINVPAIQSGSLWIDFEGERQRRLGPIDLLEMSGLENAIFRVEWQKDGFTAYSRGRASAITNKLGEDEQNLMPTQLMSLRNNLLAQIIVALCTVFLGLELSALVGKDKNEK